MAVLLTFCALYLIVGQALANYIALRDRASRMEWIGCVLFIGLAWPYWTWELLPDRSRSRW